MKPWIKRLSIIVVLAVFYSAVAAKTGRSSGAVAMRLDSLQGLELLNAKGEVVQYRGRRALKLTAPKGTKVEEMLAVVSELKFRDGVIEVDVAGSPRPDAPTEMRGFIGIAFRVQSDGQRYENIFIRPGNGRADDQLRRNHSTQYQSLPEFPWYRMRKENPGVYESYVDLETGAWTHLKIVVSGKHAFLYVNGASQPCLIVNDLRGSYDEGRIALWTHVTTEAYFSNLKVQAAK